MSKEQRKLFLLLLLTAVDMIVSIYEEEINGSKNGGKKYEQPPAANIQTITKPLQEALLQIVIFAPTRAPARCATCGVNLKLYRVG